MSEKELTKKRSIVLALDQRFADSLADKLASSSALRERFDIISHYDSKGNASDHKLLDYLSKNPLAPWMILVDDEMAMGTSGASIALNVLRNPKNLYSLDAEAMLFTGTFKDIGKMMPFLGGERGSYFSLRARNQQEPNIEDTLEKIFVYILARYAAFEARQSPAILSTKSEEAFAAQDSTVWRQQLYDDALAQERRGSISNGAAITTTQDPTSLGATSVLYGGPLRYQLTPELEELAQRLGIDPNKQLSEQSAIRRLDRKLTPDRSPE